MLDRLLAKLADHLVGLLMANLDEIAAAIARAVASELAPKLPDLSDLDEQIVAKLPDLGQIAETLTNTLISRIPNIGGLFR